MALPHFRRVTKPFFRVLLLFCLTALAPLARAAEPEKSVVQIICYSQQPAWDAPWRNGPVRAGTGSGFVVKGKRIMTNAHVVSWARQILVRRYQDAKPYLARVAFIGHDCDLALLEVQDESFFSGLAALEFGPLPKVRSAVQTCGYPAGGEQISYTRGVVSRIEMQNYVHSGNRAFLGVQTDAAINPGNSGGPVLQDDLVAGVAFQGAPGLENTGFFIPTPVINHFLKDVEDGKYDGFPSAGIRTAVLHNAAYRKLLKLPEDRAGTRIDALHAIPSTEKLLRPDDVILQIGEHPVGSDGMIQYQGNRLQLAVALQEAQHGGSVPLKLWRGGRELSVSLPVFVNDSDRKTGNQYDTPPRYFVHGGLVFTPLSLDYLKTLGRNWSDTAGSELIYELMYRRHEAPEGSRAEPIVLSLVLADAVNANFRTQGRAIVDKVNGVRVENLEDLIRGFEKAKGPQHVIEFLPKNTIECLDRAATDKANPQILKTYGIQKDRRL